MVLAVTREDVQPQRPEDVRFLIPVFHTSSACAGAATAYVLRRIAYRAGAYAPGIQEHLFHQLNTARDGGSLDRVHQWFGASSDLLQQLGYRLQCRRLTSPTAGILDWVRAGRGHRGAVLPTRYAKLHPAGAAGHDLRDDGVDHAVGIAIDRVDAKSDEELVMIDPWPGIKGDAERRKPPPALELAHRDRNYHALVFFWSGWS